MERNNKGKFVKGTGTSRGTSEETFNGFGIWYEKKGYPNIYINGKAIKLHVLIWELQNGPKPVGFEIHHKDFNKKNWNIDNLELLTNSDHRKIHAGWTKKDGQWSHKPCTGCGNILPLCEFYERKGFTPTPKCKKCHCEDKKQWAAKNMEKRKEIARDWARRNSFRRRKGVQNVGE